MRWRSRQIGELVADRETPFNDADRELLASIATHAAVALEHGRAVLRGVLAQEIHHRVKNNLQTVASLLRLQARAAETTDPREALEHSVNRILAIAAVHELLTERRDEEVDLADLIDRLRAMLVQGVGGGKEVTAALEPVELPGARATALALVFAELLQNALEHGGDRVRVELHRRDGDVELAIADDGTGVGAEVQGTGLSIVTALVRDELRGTLDLRSDGAGTRAVGRLPRVGRPNDRAVGRAAPPQSRPRIAAGLPRQASGDPSGAYAPRPRVSRTSRTRRRFVAVPSRWQPPGPPASASPTAART